MNITIIGAGLAGLSCGIHLLNQGFRVQIFEKNDRVGGRANRIDEKGFKIDMGPTLVLMPEIMDNLFRDVGRNLSDYLTLKKVDPAYQVLFSDGKSFNMTTDMNDMAKQIAKLGPGDEKQFSNYVNDVRKKLESSRGAFIERNFDSFFDMMDWNSIINAIRIKPFGNAYQHVKRYFKNDHVATALSCQCLYLGQTPHKTPALYNLLAYLEFTYGIWYPIGGMHQIPLALAKLFEEMGGELHLDAPVERIHIEERKAKGVYLKDGSLELADAVVSNRDLPASYHEFVEEKNRPKINNNKINNWNYGCSALMIYLGLNKKLDNIMHHNILVNAGLKEPSKQIFEEGRLPDEPLIYVCCPTQTDASIAPEGKDVVYLLNIVPNTSSQVNWSRDLKPFRKKVFERLKVNGIDIQEEDIELERVFTPRDFESFYGNYHGTAFGLAPDFFQSAAFRPSIKSKDVAGLYHVGASTHPGGGIPMVLTCGRLASDLIKSDYPALALAQGA